MSIPSHQLDAFFATAQSLNFSVAAKTLSITQSALSQRILQLEETLRLSLFVRSSSGVRLTDSGERLLRYCQVRGTLEEEALGDLHAHSSKDLRGTVRIGGYSSIVRSVLIPALAPFLRKHPQVRCDFISREMKDLPPLLRRAEADLIVIDHALDRADLTQVDLGIERYVVIESSKHPTPSDIYIDHDPTDTATELFFRKQKSKPKYQRRYLGDVYGVLDGAIQGLGRAVMPEHLLEKHKSLRVVRSFAPRDVPVTLHHFTLPFYSRLHTAIVEELRRTVPQSLRTK